MMKYFGTNRVIEPEGVFPISAWKLDNSREVGPKEYRINLDQIHIEQDSFQQICSSCSFDEAKIKARILDLVEKRGKIHNPFTGSGGIFIGTVEEVGEKIREAGICKVGDNICCIASLNGIPLHIDEITHVDYNYGQITCKGYAIMFEATPFTYVNHNLRSSYVLAAMDEAGSLYVLHNIAMKNKIKKLLLIGCNPYIMILYGQAIRDARADDFEAYAIMDEENKFSVPQDAIREIMKPIVKDTFFVDMTKPMKVYKDMQDEMEKIGEFDMVIVSEDIQGAEGLGILMVKDEGMVYFTNVVNNYAQGSMAAEAMGKYISTYAFDQFVEKYPEYTLDLLTRCKEKEEAIYKLYNKSKSLLKLTSHQAKSMEARGNGKVGNFIYQSNVTRSLVEDVLNVAKYDCNVIIQGETGVGKEQILSIIHQNSERCTKPCIKINCATITETLAESEFFGYETGAFTGAQAGGKMGYFEMANNGILFLDEIGTLSMNMQSKLLRVLQENQFYRVGGTKQISVNVRVIVANNVPMKQLVDSGKFREDLYYRLNICTIDVPPLRDRRDDIICLAETFVENWCKKYGVERTLSKDALHSLSSYYWPGNVRELENVIHRLVISAKGPIIRGEDVRELLNEQEYGEMVMTLKKEVQHVEKLNFKQLMDQQEKQIIEYALKKEGTTRRAADLLGLPQTTLARKKLKHGL